MFLGLYTKSEVADMVDQAIILAYRRGHLYGTHETHSAMMRTLRSMVDELPSADQPVQISPRAVLEIMEAVGI